MERRSEQEEDKVILVRNYEGAFAIYIYGQTISDWVFDIFSLMFAWFLFFFVLGKIWPFTLLYQFIWQNDWGFLIYLVSPIVFTFLMLFFKEKGLTVWAWLYTAWKRRAEGKEGHGHVPLDNSKDPIYGWRE